MLDPIISVENLGKRYRIKHQQTERYTALRDVLANKLKSWIKGPTSAARDHPAEEDYWALKDVSFEVAQGEVVGIIGRNGAGKSTLLKLLSRITEPTKGRITLKGRVASLLEVGTGFHPELTGRENIFLNGAILGMTRHEVRSKFDEIVSFAEVEKFLDTPVKRYSSGMYVRLAFAVAAHLEPEILIVDEVLAVGDAQFQKKCLGKMSDVAKGGRTILFVSHNMAAVQNLCHTGLVLERGTATFRGGALESIACYAGQGTQLASVDLAQRKERKGSGAVTVNRVTFKDASGMAVQAFGCGADAVLHMEMHNPSCKAIGQLHVAVGVDNSYSQRVTVWATNYAGTDLGPVEASHFSVSLHIPKLQLMPGRYSFTVFVEVNGEISDWVMNAGTFDVESGDYYGTGRLPGIGEAMVVQDHYFRLVSPPAN